MQPAYRVIRCTVSIKQYSSFNQIQEHKLGGEVDAASMQGHEVYCINQTVLYSRFNQIQERRRRGTPS